jgi:hypothetical protein
MARKHGKPLDPDRVVPWLAATFKRSGWKGLVAGVGDDDCGVIQLEETIAVLSADFLNATPIVEQLGLGGERNSSSMGRFMSPDWSAKVMPVPYAKLGDPQTLNLYAYVGNNPLNRTDPTGHFDDACGGGDKKCEKGLDKFDKQTARDLKSKDPKVRAAAAVWGARGDHNGIGVKFVTQQQMDADAHTASGFKTDGMVTPGVTADHKLTVKAEFSESLSGSSLGQTVAHEGSHIEDDANFVNSYNPATGNYFSGANFTHRDTEFQAFEAGAGVKPYSMFQKGPQGYQQLDDYITHAYPNADQLEFDPARFPQQ